MHLCWSGTSLFEILDPPLRSSNKGGLVLSSSCGQEDGDCNEEFDKGNDENHRLKDHGGDLIRYNRPS